MGSRAYGLGFRATDAISARKPKQDIIRFISVLRLCCTLNSQPETIWVKGLGFEGFRALGFRVHKGTAM